jgi:arsenate reductase
VNFRTRLYLDEPLDAAQLRALFRALGRSAAQSVRTKEAEYASEGLSPESDDETVIAALLRHPRLLERPVLVRGERAAVGRPTEQALALL